jgi:hypothetical protein
LDLEAIFKHTMQLLGFRCNIQACCSLGVEAVFKHGLLLLGFRSNIQICNAVPTVREIIQSLKNNTWIS